jgi:hypothetical protein
VRIDAVAAAASLFDAKIAKSAKSPKRLAVRAIVARDIRVT